MRTNLFILFLACACLNLQAQTRVVILTDFPPVDVVPGGMGFGEAEKRFRKTCRLDVTLTNRVATLHVTDIADNKWGHQCFRTHIL